MPTLTIAAGDLRSRVTLLKPSTTADSDGNQTFSPFAERWASVDTLSGAELQRAQGLNSEATFVVWMRYFPGVTTDMQVQFTTPDGTKTLTILYPDDVQNRHSKLILYCKEAQA